MNKFLQKSAIFYYSSLINSTSYFNDKRAARMAMDIFQTPRGKKLSNQQIEYLASFEKGAIHHDNQIMPYYNWKGNGKRILMLHGWESSSYRWRPYFKEMNKMGLNVFAVDAPAHGRSNGTKFSPTNYAATIKQIVEIEKINTIVAHSVGAYSTIIYSSENETPQTLKNLVLMAPTGKLQDFMTQFYDFIKLNEKVRQAFKENFLSKFGKNFDYFDSDNLIKKVSIGGILIHDKQDATLPFDDSVDIARNWPQGKFIQTKGYGHRLKGPVIKELILKYISENTQ